MDDEKYESGEQEAQREEAQREEPLGSVNGQPETDDKENNNGINPAETQAVRYDEDDERC